MGLVLSDAAISAKDGQESPESLPAVHNRRTLASPIEGIAQGHLPKVKMSVNPHKSNLFSLAVLILARYRAAFLLAILLIISITLVPSAQAALILLDQEYVPSPPPGGGVLLPSV